MWLARKICPGVAHSLVSFQTLPLFYFFWALVLPLVEPEEVVLASLKLLNLR